MERGGRTSDDYALTNGAKRNGFAGMRLHTCLNFLLYIYFGLIGTWIQVRQPKFVSGWMGLFVSAILKKQW